MLLVRIFKSSTKNRWEILFLRFLVIYILVICSKEMNWIHTQDEQSYTMQLPCKNTNQVFAETSFRGI